MATQKWLEWRDEKRKEGREDEVLLSFAFEDADKPGDELPAAYSLLMESRQMNVPIYSGAMWDWPYLLRLEINAALDGEIMYNNNKIENAERRRKWDEQQRQG